VHLVHLDLELLVEMELQAPLDRKVFLELQVLQEHQVGMDLLEHQALLQDQLDQLVLKDLMEAQASLDRKELQEPLDLLVSLVYQDQRV